MIKMVESGEKLGSYFQVLMMQISQEALII